jgi:hypothetical protein
MTSRYLSLVRPAYQNSRALVHDLRRAQEEPAIQAELDRQIAFDDQVVAAVQAIVFDDEQTAHLENLLSRSGAILTVAEDSKSSSAGLTGNPGRTQVPIPSPAVGHAAARSNRAEATESGNQEEKAEKRAPRRTILFAVGVGLLATCAMIVWMISDQMNSFAGSDRISQLLESANDLSGEEFEPVDMPAKDAEDWFFLKHGLDHFSVPPPFKEAHTLGCRVFKFNGTNVGQMMATSGKQMLFYLFPANEVGVKVRNGKWKVVEDDKWVGAVTGMNDTAFVVAIQGSRDDMQQLLAGK